MGILERQIRQRNEEQRKIEKNVQHSTIAATKQEQSSVNEIVKNISSKYTEEISSEGIEGAANEIKAAIAEEVDKLDTSFEEKKRIEKVVTSGMMGLGAIDEFMHDPDITEIMVLRYDHIVIEKNGKKYNTDASFVDEQSLQTVIQRIVQPVGRQINLSSPIVDARLPDGSRVNATIPPISVDGATLTIRKFSNKALTGEDYVNLGTMSEKMLEFLSSAVRGKANIIVSGGTNTGKTTLLNMLSGYIPEHEMIVTIEDSCELKLKSPNVRRLEAREVIGNYDNMMKVGITELVKNSLRMNPDRIIVGEIRDGTIVDMISAMSTGHEGSMSTAHANSPSNLVNSRIPIFYSMADSSFSRMTQAMQISESIDLIIQIGFSKGKRVITNITALNGLNGEHVDLQDIFTYNDGKFDYTGKIPQKLMRKLKHNGVEFPDDFFTGGE